MQDSPGVAHQASTMRRMGMVDCNPLTQSAFQQFCSGRVGAVVRHAGSRRATPVDDPVEGRGRSQHGPQDRCPAAARSARRGGAVGLEARTFGVTSPSAFNSHNPPSYPGRSAICAESSIDQTGSNPRAQARRLGFYLPQPVARFDAEGAVRRRFRQTLLPSALNFTV